MGFKVVLRVQSGRLAAALQSAFEAHSYVLVAPPEMDWGDHVAVTKYLQQLMPSVVINFVVPETPADADRELEILPALVSNCIGLNAALLHFSSYRVFGKTVPDDHLEESSVPKPRDDLGKKLLKLEQLVAEVERHMVLRVSWLLDCGPNSLLGAVIPKLLNAQPFFVSDHDFGNPLSSSVLANMLLANVQQILCGSENWGVFHLRSSDSCSEAELCDALVRIVSSLSERSVELPLVVGRGDDRRLLVGNAQLVGNRLTNNFGVQLQSWRRGLKPLVRQYLDNNA